MNDIKDTIYEQLQQLQMFMHRTAFGQRMRSPHRGQGRVLALLKLKPEISQKELTYLLNMSKQAVAELMAKLEKSGYITREPSKQDKRVMIIKLTEEGAKAADQIEDDTQYSALECLTEEELQTLSSYLERIIKQYEAQFPGEDFEQRRQSMDDFMAFHGGHGHHGHGGFHGRKGYPGRGRHGYYPERPDFRGQEDCRNMHENPGWREDNRHIIDEEE